MRNFTIDWGMGQAEFAGAASSASEFKPRKSKKMHSINLIPLINVVFLLLIFFLVAGRLEQQDLIAVDIPEAESGKLVERGEITVLMGLDGNIIVDDTLIPVEDVSKLVGEKLTDFPKAVITLKADAGLESSEMLKVLQAIQQAGGVNVSLVTQSH